MTIEQPVRIPTEEEVRHVEEKLQAVIAGHQEIAEMDFSEKEIRAASELLAERLSRSGKSAEDLDDDIMRRALEARHSVRGSEKILVSDSQGVVIGAGGSSNEARKIARQDSEARDLS